MSDLVANAIDMTFTTPKGDVVRALQNVSFTLKEGELLSVLGPSGCGKTTLLNLIAGFLRPTDGLLTLGDEEIDGPGVERGCRKRRFWSSNEKIQQKGNRAQGRGMVGNCWFARFWRYANLPIVWWNAAACCIG